MAPLQRGPFVYFLVIKSGVSIQDLASGRYIEMTRRFENAFRASGKHPFVHAAGHDHNLQVIRVDDADAARYQLVSGAASRTANARRITGTRYATNGFGYMRLDVGVSEAQLIVYAREVSGGAVRPVFTCSISEEAPASECPEAPLAGGGS